MDAEIRRILEDAVPGLDMTTEAALTKLEVLIGQGLPAEKVRTLMTRDLAGELTEAASRA